MKNQFMCENKQCVPRTSICNGAFDCNDKSDEQMNCNCKYKFLIWFVFTLHCTTINKKYLLLSKFCYLLNFLDDCVWGKWEETVCDEITNSKIASRKILRPKAGNGSCEGNARKILPCKQKYINELFGSKLSS